VEIENRFEDVCRELSSTKSGLEIFEKDEKYQQVLFKRLNTVLRCFEKHFQGYSLFDDFCAILTAARSRYLDF
jgi:hypothetical protein